MKEILFIMTLVTLAGCKVPANVEYQFMSSMDIAKKECSKIHKEGTERWLQCVEIQSLSIRSRR